MVKLYISMQISLNMMPSSNENIFRVTGHLYGEFTSDRSFDVYVDLRWING